MPDLRLDSDSSSESTGNSSDDLSPTAKLNEYGMPHSKPVFSSIGQSSVLNRAKEFLPLFRKATLQIIDPKIEKPIPLDVLLPSERTISPASDSPSSSQSSYGVEVDIGMGVFDVLGSVDENALINKGTPVILTDDRGDLEKDTGNRLIQEIFPDS